MHPAVTVYMNFFVCKEIIYNVCKMYVVFYTVNLCMHVYDLFHILLYL